MYRWLKTRPRLLMIATATALTLVLAGCTTAKRTASDGEQAFKHQNWDAAVYHYLQALAEDPENIEYKMQLAFARQKAAHKHFDNGVMLRRLGRLLAARNELQMAIQLDPSNQYAEQILEDVINEMQILSTPDGARELERLKREASQAKVKPPVLDPTSEEPITLNFPRPKPVKEIYSAIGKAYGFNVLFDPKLKDDRLSIELRDLTAEQALEMVMQGAGHFYKVLDEHSIIIAFIGDFVLIRLFFFGEEGIDGRDDIIPDTDYQLDFFGFDQGGNIVGLGNVGRVVDEDFHFAGGHFPIQRNPDILRQKSFFQLGQQFEWDRCFRVKGLKGAFIEQ